MKKSKILLIIIFLIAAAAILYFAYGVAKNRYLAPTPPQSSPRAGEEASGQTGDQAVGDQVSAPTEVDNIAPTNGQPDVQSTDCDNNCANFADSADNLKYCQEVCGDRPVATKDSESQCANLAGLEKDSCWRDLAVSKKDFAVCDKISDAKLKKVCKNRVTEEVLN